MVTTTKEQLQLIQVEVFATKLKHFIMKLTIKQVAIEVPSISES
jgi:hypothetical protein